MIEMSCKPPIQKHSKHSLINTKITLSTITKTSVTENHGPKLSGLH